jgi:hypothetical protein
MKINYKVGDLFQSVDWDSPIVKLIPHCCNDINSFGSGFAGAVARHFPEVKERYHSWCNKGVDFQSGKPFELGQFQSVQVNKNTYFLNMIGQRGVRGQDNPKPCKYGHLFTCIKDISTMIQLSKNSEVEIITVKFGSDLAGGDFQIIKEFIEDYWSFVPVTIFSLA